MSNLNTLLRDADPVRHEARQPEARERVRQTVLRAAPADRSTLVRWPRLKVAVVLAMIVAAAALGYQLWQQGTTAVLAAVRFEVRLAERDPVPGLTVAQVGESGQLIYLHPEVVVNNDDIAQSWVVPNAANRFGIAVTLTSSGAERMRQATTAHVGRPVAILIDGRIVSAPTVRSPLGESAMLSGLYTKAEADRIVAGIGLRP